jgi:hypothetical protein
MRVEYVTVPLAILAFGIAVFQYWKAQKWKRAEFVAAEIKDALLDPSVRNALYFLDWNERNYDLRERDDQEELGDVPVADADFMMALAPHLDRPEGFSHVEERIRVVFDDFLGRLQRFEHFIEAGLVTTHDVLPYWRYWLELMTTPSPTHKSAEVLEAIWRYIDFYGYSDVRKFVERFGYDLSRFPK